MTVILPPDDNENGVKKAVNEFYADIPTGVKEEDIRLQRAKEAAAERWANVGCSVAFAIAMIALLVGLWNIYNAKYRDVPSPPPMPVGFGEMQRGNIPDDIINIHFDDEDATPVYGSETILSYYPVKWSECAYQPSYYREDLGVWCWSVAASSGYANGNKYHLNDPAKATVLRAFITDDPFYMIVMDEIGAEYSGIRVDLPETTWELFPDLSKRDGLYFVGDIEVMK